MTDATFLIASDNKLKGEDLLRQSGAKYTIIRPGGLTNGPGGKEELEIGAFCLLQVVS